MSRSAIGVDVGGTFTKLVLVDQDGNILLRDSIPTPKDAAPGPIVDRIVEAGLSFKERAESEDLTIAGIGIAIPHFHVGRDWVQQQTNNMPTLEGFPMRPPLYEAFGPSIAMVNDVSATGIAEHLFGKGRDCTRMLLVAIGTGIATSVITEEHGLVHYSWDTTGDTGQIIVDPYGLADCTCGGRGCVEAVAAAPAIRRRALREVERGKDTLLAEMLQRKGDLEARDVSEAAEKGDEVARDIMDQAGFFLGVAITSYLHIFRPTLIVLGGGVALAGSLLVDPIRRTMHRLASPWYLQRLEGIEVSALGKDGGAIGAASLILYPGRYLPAPNEEC